MPQSVFISRSGIGKARVRPPVDASAARDLAGAWLQMVARRSLSLRRRARYAWQNESDKARAMARAAQAAWLSSIIDAFDPPRSAPSSRGIVAVEIIRARRKTKLACCSISRSRICFSRGTAHLLLRYPEPRELRQ